MGLTAGSGRDEEGDRDSISAMPRSVRATTGPAVDEMLAALMTEAFAYCRVVREPREASDDIRILTANASFQRLFGIAEPAGKALAELDQEMPQKQHGLCELALRVAETGRPEFREDYYPHLDKWLRVRVESDGQDLILAIFDDITEHKALEHSLHATQISVDQAPDMIHWLDSHGRLVYANQATADILGYSLEELVTLHVWDIDPEVSPEFFATIWNEKTQAQATICREAFLRTKDGRLVPAEISTSFVEFEGDYLAFSFVREITERRRLEDSLRLTQITVDRSPDMILWVNGDGSVAYANQALLSYLGYTEDERASLHFWDLVPDVTAEQHAKRWEEGMNRRSLRHEGALIHKDGRVLPVEVTSTSAALAGRTVGVHVARDITERKRIEKSLRLTQTSVDLAPEPIHWEDESGRIVYANRAACELLGYTREEFETLHIWNIDPAVTAESFHERWEAWRDEPALRIDTTLRAKDGRSIEVEVLVNNSDLAEGHIGVSYLRDVTEHKAAERTLRESEERYRQLFELESDAIMLVDDKTWEILEVNEAAVALYGYTREELLGMKLYQLSTDPEASRLASMEPVFDIPLRWHRKKDGTVFPVEARGRHFEWKGRTLHVAAIRDITERRRAEESLLVTQMTVDNSPDAIQWVDETGRLIYVNQASCNLLGYSREQLTQMHVWDFDKAFTAETWPREWARINAIAPVVEQSTITSADGREHVAEVSSSYVEYEGKGYGISVIRDITARVRAEEEPEESRRMLRMVIDTVPLRIAWRDRELRYLGCNKEIAADVGLPDTSAVVGLTDQDLTGWRVPPEALEDDRRIIETGVPKLQYDEVVPAPDGRARTLRTSKVPLRDRVGNIVGVLGVHEDVTEHMEALRALKERDEQLRQSQKMQAVGRLAGGIAHDFNNVLTTIIGYSDLILSSPDCPAGTLAEDIGEIKAAALRASSLTRQILAFSRRQTLQPVVLNLNTVIADTERLLARTLGADVELTTALAPDLGQVEVDEHQLVQVLLNLAVNARDAMPGGGRLTVSTENVYLDEEFCAQNPEVHPGAYVAVTVTDTGIGMDEDTLAHAFEPFYTTKPPGEGTGLGLSTVYGVVAQSGGHTSVSSAPGEGTTFTMYLPRVDHVIEETAADAAVGAVGARGASTTALVVEDDATFRSLTVRMLNKRGYDAISVGDGDQALAILGSRSTGVDILLTDIVLPGSLQGRDVARQAKNLRPGLPIVFMSSYAREGLEQSGRLTADAYFVEKPFTAQELDDQIRSVLDQTQTHPRPEAHT